MSVFLSLFWKTEDDFTVNAFWRTSKYQHGHQFYARKPIDLIIDF